METVISTPTRVGLGFATHTDAFQCGREAAQSAKNQLGDGKLDLVLVFGPGSIYLKNFIEGVRLVVGEECLVAIPTKAVLSNENTVPNGCLVVAIASSTIRISVAAEESKTTHDFRGTTSIISQFRRARGNAHREFSQRGCLLFSHNLAADNLLTSQTIAADMGLESWIIGASTDIDGHFPITCSNKQIANGLLGVEFLSSKPVGIGSVAIDSSMHRPDMVQEAVKTALRDAAHPMSPGSAVLGFALINTRGHAPIDLSAGILKNAASLLPNVPLIGIASRHHFVRRTNRSLPSPDDSIIVMLVPA